MNQKSQNTNNKEKNEGQNSITSFFSKLSQDDNDKLTKQAENVETEGQNALQILSNFGKYIASELEFDWEEVSQQERDDFSFNVYNLYNEMLENFVLTMKNEPLEKAILLYIKSGFNKKFIDENNDLQLTLQLFNQTFIETLKDIKEEELSQQTTDEQ